MVKRLVVCCDGTWSVPDHVDSGKVSPTNVARMALAVAPQAAGGIAQPIYYGKGVGTGMWDRFRGGAFGWGLSAHVQDAYRFVCEQFAPGDDIFLFGFS